MPSFRVLPTWISRSYSKVQNPHDKWTSWRRSSSFGLAKGHFGAFENKINSNWSLLIQIGEFWINIWIALTSLLCTGCSFHSQIFDFHRDLYYAPKRRNCSPSFIYQRQLHLQQTKKARNGLLSTKLLSFCEYNG